MHLIKDFHAKYIFERRVKRLASELLACLPDQGEVLDVGCGDGRIDALMREARPGLALQGIDIVARPTTHIPVRIFDGQRIPHGDRSFDIVLFIDVLHHTDAPQELLREAIRVARRGILIKDHLVEGLLARKTLRLMDWVGNAPHGIRLPYNYWTRQEWQEACRALRLRPSIWKEAIGLYPRPLSWFFDRHLHFIALLAIEEPEG